MTDILNRIKLVDFPEDEYIREETNKVQIYLHHTAGNSNPYAQVEDWARREGRVATSFIVGGIPPKGVTLWQDGQIVQTFSSKYWGYSLGLKVANLPAGSKTVKELEQGNIGIEICNWGWVTKRPDGKFINYVGGIMKPEEVIELDTPFRGYKYWHNYTDAQIQSTVNLLRFLCDRWGIPKKFIGMEIFSVNQNAFMGVPGIYTHCSVRKDKTDIYPHPKLIEALKTL